MYVYGWLLRVRNSLTRSVLAECVDPMSTTSPIPVLMISMRRRMKARIRMSLSSASVWTSAESCARSSFNTSPDSRTQDRKNARRPGNHVDLAGELTGSVNGDDRVASRRESHDFNLAGLDDVERRGLLTDLDEDLSLPNRADDTMGLDSGDLRGCQRREHPPAVGIRSERKERRSISHRDMTFYHGPWRKGKLGP